MDAITFIAYNIFSSNICNTITVYLETLTMQFQAKFYELMIN